MKQHRLDWTKLISRVCKESQISSDYYLRKKRKKFSTDKNSISDFSLIARSHSTDNSRDRSFRFVDRLMTPSSGAFKPKLLAFRFYTLLTHRRKGNSCSIVRKWFDIAPENVWPSEAARVLTNRVSSRSPWKLRDSFRATYDRYRRLLLSTDSRNDYTVVNVKNKKNVISKDIIEADDFGDRRTVQSDRFPHLISI